MKTESLKCQNCRRVIRHPNPRIKNQQYCSRKRCQRARKRKWQRRKMSSDQDYRLNQEDARTKWREENPDYSRRYREEHPEYCERNRLLQKRRDARRRCQDLAKMDASSPISFDNSEGYRIFPADSDLAKMDAFSPIYLIIPAGCAREAASCKKGFDVLDSSLDVPWRKKEVANDDLSDTSRSSP